MRFVGASLLFLIPSLAWARDADAVCEQAKVTALSGDLTGLKCAGLATIFVNKAIDSAEPLHAAMQEAAAAASGAVVVQPATASSSADGVGATTLSAAPSIQPTASSGGSVGLVGGPNGQTALVALSVNPWGLGADATDGTSAASKNRAMRSGDITLLVPASVASGSAKLDYVGLRARINGAAAMAPDKWSKLAVVIQSEEAAKTSAAVRLAATWNELSDTDQARCLAALGETKPTLEGIRKGCGGQGTVVADILGSLSEPKAALNVAEDAWRNEVDNSYWGADVSGDFGDLTQITGSADTVDFRADLAGGYRMPDGLFAVRGRAGFHYTGTATSGAGGFDFGGALALASTSKGVRSPTSASLGAQGSILGFGTAPPTTTLDIVVGASIPSSSNNAINVGIAIPVLGPNAGDGATLTITGDWSLLTSKS